MKQDVGAVGRRRRALPRAASGLVALTCALAPASVAAQAPVPPDGPDVAVPSAVVTALTDYVQEFSPLACTVGVTGADPDGADIRHFGTTGVPNDDSLWQVASVTKTFTTTLIALLAQQGKLDVEAPVRSVLVDTAFPDAVTIVSLATHTSGLTRQPEDIFTSPGLDTCTSFAHYSKPDLRHYLENVLELNETRIGEFAYSNTGLAVLGLVIEEVMGVPYDEVLATEILAPLGMNDTYLTPPPLLPEQLARVATPYLQVVPKPIEVDLNLWGAFAPAAGLVTTAADLLKYGAANVRGRRCVEGFADGCTPLELAMGAAQEPRVIGASDAEAGSIADAMGLGWFQVLQFGPALAYHEGDSIGHSSLLGVNATQGEAVAVMCNVGQSDAATRVVAGLGVVREWVAGGPVEQPLEFPAQRSWPEAIGALTEAAGLEDSMEDLGIDPRRLELCEQFQEALESVQPAAAAPARVAVGPVAAVAA